MFCPRKKFLCYLYINIYLGYFQTLHPFYDQNSCLIIQLFGLEVAYHPKPNHNEPGTVTDNRGGTLSLEDESRIIGWAMLPLFEG